MAKKKKSSLRPVIQVLFFLLVALISINHTLEEAGKPVIPILSAASLHALCPFGGVVSIYQVVTAGTFVKKVHESAFVLMGLGLLVALFFGPVFCGWICPLGSVQEWVGKLGKRINKKRYNRYVPKKLDTYLRYLRYLVLGWVIYMTAATGTLIFAEYDPYYTLFNLWTEEVALSGIIILALVLLLSLVVERPFCKYACPYGALLGIFNLFRIFPIKRVAPTCIDCKACDRVCPMNITVSTASKVKDHQCITCMKCTSDQSCPVQNTVILGEVSKKGGAV